MTELLAKLEQFRATLESDQRARLKAEGYETAITLGDHKCKLKPGRKYVNVDVGRSGKYMIELATGKIFGIKGYGVIHRGHQYGTLDTVNNWNWSGYTAVPKGV